MEWVCLGTHTTALNSACELREPLLWGSTRSCSSADFKYLDHPGLLLLEVTYRVRTP